MPTLQNLTPKNARLCLKIENICRQRLGIAPGSKLLLAVSGGPDSLALATIFLVIAPRMDFSLSCLHVDHHLRPSSAWEAKFVRDFCEGMGLECVIAHADVQAIANSGKCGIEEAGRLARHKLLEDRAGAINADYILTGHQAEDLAEDIMMRLLRGAGWPALSGMGWRNGHIRRPLLHESPERLKSFLKSCGLDWINDESNQSLAFRRNRVRHLLMPMLRCENPAIINSFERVHDLGQLDADYWREILDKALAETPWHLDMENGILILPKELLRPLHPAARLRLYHKALGHLRAGVFGGGQSRNDNLQRLEEVFLSGIGGKMIQCGGGITATIEHGGIVLRSAPRK